MGIVKGNRWFLRAVAGTQGEVELSTVGVNSGYPRLGFWEPCG